MHKAELQIIMLNNDNINFKAEVADRIGTFVLGLSTALYFFSESSLYNVMSLFMMGVFFTFFGIREKTKRNHLIQQLFDEKMKDCVKE